MRILIVSPWLPHRDIAHGGGQHLYQTLRSLAERGHTLYVLCYGRAESEAQLQTLKSLCSALYIITPAYTWKQKAMRLWQDGWRRPFTLGRRTHLEAQAYIRMVCKEQDIDVVHFMWTEMGRYIEAVPQGVGTVLGTLDVEYRVRPREVALYRIGWRRAVAAYKVRCLIRAERRYVQQADVILACSFADQQCLTRIRDAGRVYVVPPWADIVTMNAAASQQMTPGRLTFMGAMDRLANVAAAQFLIADIWPRVRAVHPAAMLYIVGVNPPAALRRRAREDPQLVVTGFVPDLANVWGKTDVAVAPSLVGGGILLKVAQPMAAGRPVVTTTPGNEGVAAPAGVAVEVADTASAFAEAVLKLLADRAHWARLADAGQRHVMGLLDWHASLRSLEAAYAVAVEQARNRL